MKIRSFKLPFSIKNNLVFIILGLVFLLALVGMLFELIPNRSDNGKSDNNNGIQAFPTDIPTSTPVSNNSPANYFDASFLNLPQGFKANVFARDLGKVRAMAADSAGNLYATVQDQGKLIVLKDTDGNGVADLTATMLSSLKNPHGIEIVCTEATSYCLLFLAETNQVTKYKLDLNTQSVSDPELIVKLPDDGLHVTRSILLRNFDGVNYILVSIGSSCDSCVETEKHRASIIRVNLQTYQIEDFATGLRNSVFLTFDPADGAIYATDNGRDWLGDTVPVDEINRIDQGKFYGWPYCYGKNIVDKTVDATNVGEDKCAEATPPLVEIPAHSAPLGIRFMPNNYSWGSDYNRTVFVALHGSTNRTDMVGYKVMKYKIDQNGKWADGEEFLGGFINSENTIKGRPVDIFFSKKGEMFVTDDKEGRIYRIVKE